MDIYDYKLDALAKSKFRNSFHLKEKDFDYINKIGIDKLKEHAIDFVIGRLKNKLINDGKQTPTHGHPIFIGMHACACCCRGCLYKWHKIKEDKELDDSEINFIVTLLMRWIDREIKKHSS